jgi:Ca2+-binding EF-hand superfamily protein
VKKLPLLIACVLACSAAVAQEQASPSDHEAMRQQKADAAFTDSDRNHDGKLSLAEWQAARNQKLAEQFRKLDANNDGALSQDEMRQAHEHHGMGGHHQGGEGMREKMQALDTDHDGAWSRAEIGDQLPRLSENFDSIDSNHDGKITREEMRAGRESMRAQSPSQPEPQSH